MDLLFSGFNMLLIVLGFGLLIFVHELGHFLAAKWAGIRTEAFAVGMGPVIASWRKGVGLSLGSTHRKVVDMTGKAAAELTDDELEQTGIGETEYSLRWVPIGGFVKMLGQDDVNPAAVSNDPRSYNRCAIGRRMVVVSAGVIMNLILAAVFFVLAFLAGVPFPAPVIGDVRPGLPAATTVASNAEVLGVSEPGIQPGDRVISIDGKPAETFADLQIASAMSRPDVALEVTVERAGLDEPLLFPIVPRKDSGSGLLSVGVAPASSTTLMSRDTAGVLAAALAETGLAASGVDPGMRLLAANGSPIATYEQLDRIVRASEGAPVATTWARVEDDEPVGPRIDAELPVEPVFQVLIYPPGTPEGLPNFERGLIGLVPLIRIESVEGSANAGTLRAGDIVLRAGSIDGPRTADFMAELQSRRGGSIDLLVLRDGEPTPVTASVDRKGRLQVLIGAALDVPLVARPMSRVRPSLAASDRDRLEPTPVAELGIMARSRLVAAAGQPVSDWGELREVLRAGTAAAYADGAGAELTLDVEYPTPGREQVEMKLALGADDVAALHELTWTTQLPGAFFEPIYTTRDAGGNPLAAISMGLQETHKLVLMTYLTIDRLFRGSVGVEQLRGPLGIVHMGSQIADSGLTYLIFFLAMISVNLAVINFLPLPIVDGGLFLFLVYEKIKGRPPSVAFQNAATILGICLIGTVLLVVTWNDVMRLL
ncbi:MAG: site-2 protease family protein [Planctomycetota bacterium]|jgi:regulator of sigma E protease